MHQFVSLSVATLGKFLRDNRCRKAMFCRIIQEFESLLEEDITTNKQIGKNGAEDILKKCGNRPVRILTHCNTGSLATAGYGTALGKIAYLSHLYWFTCKVFLLLL